VGLPDAVWGRAPVDTAAYRRVDYDRLRMLPLPSGGSRSIFGPEGVIPNTERGARYVYWPMGVASAGSMRQSGRQPTTFVGRRHFDDPDLLEKRYERLR
jgi:hypothetical protein